MVERTDRRIVRERRENAARSRIRRALDREEVRSAIKAAGAKDVDDEAVEAVCALCEERFARLAARVVEASEDRSEDRLSAATVAVAAERESDSRRAIER